MANNSTLITNRDATPKVLTDSFIANGVLSQGYGWVFTGGTDVAGTAYRMVSVPSNSRLSSLEMTNTTLGNSSSIDVGVWYPTQIPSGGGAFLAQSLAGTLIGSSLFKTAILGDTLNSTPGQLMSTTFTRQQPNFQEMPFWQMIGLTADPIMDLDVGFVVRVAVATAGYLGLKATYLF
jgi:hypothetical protein